MLHPNLMNYGPLYLPYMLSKVLPIHTRDISVGGMATFTVNIPINAHMFIIPDIYFNVNQVSTCWVRENLLIQHIRLLSGQLGVLQD